jgi:hypothetical protein
MLRTLAKRCRRFTPLLAAPAALLLSQGEAKAVLTFNIFESAGNVVVQTSGSLDLTGATQLGQNSCGYNGYIQSSLAVICSGLNLTLDAYRITGPAFFNGFVSDPADSRSGITATFNGNEGIFTIGPAYVSNTSVVSSATFIGKTLASLGFTTTGLIGTWTLTGTSETIQVILGAPTPSGATVPGPLPLLGAGAAFGWSRRLRKRIAAPLITPPQA